MTARPKVGDRVRIVLEGIAGNRVADGVPGMYLAVGGSTVWLSDAAMPSIEVLPPPEPEWATGDVGRCEHNHTYLRTVDGGWVNTRGEVSGNTTCARTPLVLNGKPVTS